VAGENMVFMVKVDPSGPDHRREGVGLSKEE
jgi:hypothetical protein